VHQIVEDTCELIRLNTTNPPGNEVVAATWLRDRTLNIGMQTELVELSHNRANCIAQYDFGPGPTFVLCTHLDVVPGQKELFQPKILGNRLFGRGSCDAKGALAAMVHACEKIINSQEIFVGKLVIAAVCDEEVGASGAKKLVSTGFNADGIIIGEPTSNKLLFKSRGVIRAKIIIEGTSGHASMPDESINAISAAGILIEKLDLFNKKLAIKDEGTCSVTMINGGTAVNVIPNRCEVVIDRRISPHTDILSAEKELENLIRNCLENTKVKWFREQAGVNVEPLDTSLDSSFYKRITNTIDIEIGTYFPAVTDAPHFSKSGIPTAILGPGNIEQAHTENEWVDVDELIYASELYSSIIKSFLLQNSR
jgi:acetylornithine deacetylase/succinyl-diaminopimelate desuccinylase